MLGAGVERGERPAADDAVERIEAVDTLILDHARELAVSASGIIVNPSVPAKNLKEFIAYIKANQDKFLTARPRRHR